MSLNDTAIRHLKPAARPYKVSDSGGLFLLVQPSGSKLWRLAYRFGGKQRGLSLGVYPTIGLSKARERRDSAKRLLADGVDPSAERKAAKRAEAAAETFAAVADAWFAAKMEREGKSERTLERSRRLLRVLKADVGKRPIGSIEPPELLDLLRKVEARGHHETVSRLRSVASQVFRFGIASGCCTRDPAADLRGALTTPTERHRPAITDPVEVGALMRAIDGYPTPVTRAALQLLALTFVRPGELRSAEWREVDVSAAVWAIPAEKMKMREPHRVPLSRQALSIMEELRPLTGTSRFLFPAVGARGRCLSENTLNSALRRLGYDGETMVAHGFRASASTLLNEEQRWGADVIERQLAHREQNSIRRAYNRSALWLERVALMQHWADRLDELRNRGRVVQLQTAAR